MTDKRVMLELPPAPAMNKLEGHDEPCYYCKKPCNSLAGNPGLWPVALCHSDEPGVVKWHHTGCVMERLHRLDLAEKVVEALRAYVMEHRDDPENLCHDISACEACQAQLVSNESLIDALCAYDVLIGMCASRTVKGRG